MGRGEARTRPGRDRPGQDPAEELPAPLSAQRISAKTGIKYAVVRVLLSRMKRHGEVAPGVA
jgi:hypothetical protein